MIILRHIALIYGSALIMGFFSEMFFFNEGPAYSVIGLLDDPPTLIWHLFELGLWYSLAAAPVLWALWRFEVHDIWGLFLAGVIFGYLTEGLIVPAIYYELPSSLLWVAASWHPLACVVLGWWAVRRILAHNRPVQTILLSIALGLFWGTWTTVLIGAEVDQAVAGDVVRVGEVFEPIPIGQFAAFTLITTAMWVLGNLMVDRLGPRDYAPPRAERAVLGLLVLAAFVLMVLTVQVLAAVLALAVAICLLGLAGLNRRAARGAPVFRQFGRIDLLNHLLVFVTPVTAVLVYDVMVSNGWQVEPLLFAAPISVAGAAMLAISLLRAALPGRAATA